MTNRWRALAGLALVAPWVLGAAGCCEDRLLSADEIRELFAGQTVTGYHEKRGYLVRMVKVELAHDSPRGAPRRLDYFTARKVTGGAGSPRVLEELFRKSIQQLQDYAVERLGANTPTVALPVQSTHKALAVHAGKLESRLLLGLARARPFKLVVKKEMPRLITTINAQLALKYDSAKASQIGKLVPARLAVLGRLSKGSAGQVELLIKLVRLETGEILSVSLLRIDRRLLA